MEYINIISFIENYADAPKEATYILRKYDMTGNWRLEAYSKDGKHSSILKEFRFTFSVEDFHDLLQSCRKIIGKPGEVLWVEKPDVLLACGDEEINELYKQFVFPSRDDSLFFDDNLEFQDYSDFTTLE